MQSPIINGSGLGLYSIIAKGLWDIWTVVGQKTQRRQWHPTPVVLPGKSHEWRSLVGCSPWGRKELDTTEWLPFHFSLSCIGKEMATHSSVLAWRIPGTGEPAGLLSMGLHRIGHDGSDLAAAAAGQKTVGSLFSLWPYPWVVAGSNILSMCRWVQGHCAFCWPCEWLWGLTRVASGIKCLCG